MAGICLKSCAQSRMYSGFMLTYAALVLLGLAAAAAKIKPTCRIAVKCPCGKSGNNFTICSEEPSTENVCSRWAGCKRCQDGLGECLECQDGLEGPLCTKASQRKKIPRQKRQSVERYDLMDGSDREYEGAGSRRPSGSRTCEDPGQITNGRRWLLRDGTESDTSRTFRSGESVTYDCLDDEFHLTGSAVLTCRNGAWSSSLPQCRRSGASGTLSAVTCPDPGQVQNADRVDSAGSPSLGAQTFEVGQSVAYNCHPGFALRRRSLITCLSTGTWSNLRPYCIPIQPPPRNAPSNRERKYCQSPGGLLDGTFTVVLPEDFSGSKPSVDDDVEYPEGTRLVYFCDEDYALIGSSVLTCQSTGSWSSTPPICSSECGRTFVETNIGLANQRILHGRTTEAGEWPWVVAIGMQYGNFTQIECAGALLNSQTVITAAHCLVADTFTLYFGKVHRSVSKDDTEVMVRQSTRWIRHPDFNSTNLDSDIGLIIFSPSVLFSDRVQPICPPSRESTARNLMTGRSGYVTGWGLTERQLPAEELRMAQLPVLTNSACKESYRKLNTNVLITRNMFCAGFENAQQAVCSGDSGSPLVFDNNISGRYTIEGLVSFGVQGQCGMPGRYTLFTRVLPFVPWILRNLA